MLANVGIKLITGVISTVVDGSVYAGHDDDDVFIYFVLHIFLDLVSHEPVNNLIFEEPEFLYISSCFDVTFLAKHELCAQCTLASVAARLSLSVTIRIQNS